MFFEIDPSGEVPVYEQVERQVTFAVASGALRSGELIPSVRQLARELAINPNTVARAYRQLQDDGVLTAVRGTGLQVAQGARPQCQQSRLRLIRQRIKLALGEALQSQLGVEDIRQIVDEELTNGKATSDAFE